MMFLPEDRFVGRLVPAVIEPSRCTTLLAELAARGFSRTGEQYPSDYRNNDRLVFDDAALAAELATRLAGHVPVELVDGGSRWQLVGFNARFRACRYANGQAFCIHRDGAYVPSDTVRSFLTVQLYLDDDPQRAGGRTRFYADPQGHVLWAAIAPTVGSVIVFDHRVWHDGEPVTAGIKHVLRTDAVYERIGATALDEPGVIRRHRGYAWCAIACRDGSIASSGRDGTVRSGHVDVDGWNTTGAARVGETMRALDDGSMASTAWDRANRRGESIHDLHDGSITTVAEAPDGTLWCGSRAGSIHRIAPAEGPRIESASAAHHGAESVSRVATDLGAVLASATSGGLVAFTTARGQVHAFTTTRVWVVDAHDGWARGITAHHGGFASCGHDGRVILIAPDGRAREHAHLPTALRAILSDGEVIHVGDDRGWVHTLSREGSVLRSRRAHAGAVTCLAIDEGVVSAGEDGVIKRGDVVLAQLGDFVTSLAVTADGLVVAGYDGAIRLLG